MDDNIVKIGCVVLAAGCSSRFGSNKLLRKYDGQSLAQRALDAVPEDRLDKIVVVTGYPEVRDLAVARGFEVVNNDRPDEGLSLTIRLGLERMLAMDAALFMVCDQPLLKRASVMGAMELYCRHPDRIVSLASKGERGNPCIFPSRLFSELSALSGDSGGSTIISSHEESLLLFEIADASELKDADYEKDLDEIRGRSPDSEKECMKAWLKL
jgi:molybdenum cofactor cytidylyltransferase